MIVIVNPKRVKDLLPQVKLAVESNVIERPPVPEPVYELMMIFVLASWVDKVLTLRLPLLAVVQEKVPLERETPLVAALLTVISDGSRRSVPASPLGARDDTRPVK